MKGLIRLVLLIGCFWVNALNAQKVISVKIDGPIHPPAAAFIKSGIQEAEESGASCLLIHLNTPGGLLKSTRVIVGDILESRVPVVVYVAPGGAHAGSAGVFITMAAHVAAMAPGTNIGAAHPVGAQGGITDTVMNEKTTNDAAAFIRAIARKRNRNFDWAEQAVRNSVSLSEEEALENNVIDLVAASERELLTKLEGKAIQLQSGTHTLKTASADIVRKEMSFWEKLLDKISDPNIAYILMMVGFYGILFELYNPGAMVPGIAGVISLILAFYSMHTLPVNMAGLALIIFAIILFLLEIKVTSYGMLTIGGVISLFLGSVMLIRSGSPWEVVQISLGVIIPATILTALFFITVIGIGLKAQRSTPFSGVESMLGSVGVSTTPLVPTGTVKLHGELWTARSLKGDIEQGREVKVVKVQDLTLLVEPVEDNGMV